MSSGYLYTGRIYDFEKIRYKHPDIHLISVMRYNPRWISSERIKKSNIELLPILGPPPKLLSETKKSLQDSTIDELEIQIRYTSRYFDYLFNNMESLSKIEDIVKMIEDGSNIVLLCNENPGEFCHRRLLYHLIINRTGNEVGGGEIKIE